MQTITQGTIVHTEFATNDAAATKDFLGQVFGWTFEEVPGENPYTMIKGPDGPLGGVRHIMAEEPGPSTTSYVGVDSLEDCMRSIEESGGKIIVPATEVPGMGRFCWFQTPGGCVLAAWERVADRFP